MTCSCDAPSGDDDREAPADAPAIAAILPQVRRLLRALFARPHASDETPRLTRLHRLNDYQLKDIGLTCENNMDRTLKK
jgi:uncharacterized protein YjiS (DUF1127 family)